MKYFSAGFFFLLIAAIFLVSCGSSRKAQAPITTTPVPSFKIDTTLTAKLGQPVPEGANPVLVDAMADWLGVPYKYGGADKNGVDCSGLISNIYPRVYAKQLPRTTLEMFKTASPVQRSELKEGDLVFFNIETAQPGHSGIFLWHDYFLHASTSRGVIISRLSEPYWKKYFMGAGRLLSSKP